jgi:hypothetical protein
MSIKLTVLPLSFDEDTGPSTKVFDKDEITLGSDPSSDLVLDRPEVGQRHASLRVGYSEKQKKPSLFVKDLGTGSGTFVEDQSLSSQIEVEMMPNERIIIGQYLIKPAIEKKSFIEIDRIESNVSSENSEIAPSKMKNTIEVSLVGEKIENLDFEATELFRLSGFVLYRGKPLANVRIDAGSHGATESRADGSFLIGGVLEDSSYSLHFSKPGYDFDCPCSSGFVTGNLDFNVEAVRLFAVAGTVLHLGSALKNVKIDAGALGHFITDDDGRFLIRDVRELTEYHIKAEKKGFVIDTPGSQGIVHSGPVSLLFTAKQLFSISGTVLHKGKPMAGVKVVAKDIGELLTNGDGRYSFGNLPEGSDYTISVSKKNFTFKSIKK